MKDCRKIHLLDRKCPDNIKADLQSCGKDSLDCDYLERTCKLNNYCWDKNTLKGPKCYLPIKTLNQYLNFRDENIIPAIEAAGLYVKTKKSNLTHEFENQLLNVIKSSRLLRWEQGNVCSCHDEYSCYPC